MSNNRPLIILAFAVILIVGGSLWFLNSGPNLPPSTAGTPAAVATVKPATPQPRETTTSSPKVASNEVKAAPQVPKATPRPLQDWELKIDEVLRSSADETQTAQILINMLPTLPPDGQSEAAQHISNLILDDQYNRVLPLVKNPNLPEDVLDVFVTDLMNRDDAVKLPALLDIAKIPNHPHHEEALSDLEIFIDEGSDIPPNDWARWDSAVKGYLKKQAAEEAAENAAPAPGKPGVAPKK